MSAKILPFFVCLLACQPSCNEQKSFRESDELRKAKWYFYSFAMDLQAFDSKELEISPLLCEVNYSRTLNSGSDTVTVFFSKFNHDTSNPCIFKPIDLVGVSIIGGRLYSPIYHGLEFDKESAEFSLKRMKKLDSLLRSRIMYDKAGINQWLRSEFDRLIDLPSPVE